jgi:hypothetical protein
MKSFLPSLATAALAGCLSLAPHQSSAAPLELKAVQIGKRIDVTAGGRFFTSYRFADDEKYPFFFPVNGPSGASVTSMRNGEYPHHSSLFFGCDMLNGGNYWQEGLERGRIISQGPKLVRASGAVIEWTDRCDWKREGSHPLRDTRRITLRAPSATLRVIDFDITLEALEDVRILRTNHSLFSARMDPDLTPAMGGRMVNAEGLSGEKATFGKPSAWLACYGPRGGKGGQEGLAILQHPENPGGPSPWFTRDYGFLSPTPMYWPADNKATSIAKGEKLRLRYRVLVFSGTPDTVDIASWQSAFAAGKEQP